MTKRQTSYQRNEALEHLLTEINYHLGIAETQILQSFEMPKYPVVLLVGCARSGSTLFMQWLAHTDAFAYPTNFLSRFYQAPYLGGKIQQMLIDPKYSFRDELADYKNEILYTSNLGKTKGIAAPNEFYYFWRRFFDYGEIQFLDEEACRTVDADTFLAELAALEAVFDKPLAMKGLIINWNIPFVSSILDKVLFVHITRNPLYNAQSLLEARMKFFGTQDIWYSFKPPEYDRLKDLSPYEQVAGQVYYTNQAIKLGCATLDNSRWMKVSYEQFCNDPGLAFSQIAEKIYQQGYEVNPEYNGSAQFDVKNQNRIGQDEMQKISDAYEFFSGESVL